MPLPTIPLSIGRFATFVATLACLPAASLAQEVAACDLRASARNLAEPWDANTMTFADGAIRVAVIDMIEPAGGAFYLLVLSPPRNEIGDRQCRFVGAQNGIGFWSLDMKGTEAAYDPATGLTLTIPAAVTGPGDTGAPPLRPLTVTINQATGEVTASHPG